MSARQVFKNYADGSGNTDLAGAVLALADLGLLECVDATRLATELLALHSQDPNSTISFGKFHQFQGVAYRLQSFYKQKYSRSVKNYPLRKDLLALFEDATGGLNLTLSAFANLLAGVKLFDSHRLVCARPTDSGAGGIACS